MAASIFRHIFPDVARNLSETRDGHTGVDLMHTGRLAVQVKNHRGYVPVNTINEIQPDDGRMPVLVTKAHSKPWMAVLRLDDLISILDDVGIVFEEVA